MQTEQRFFRWALALLVVTVLVVLWGAVVRVTGSGAGCADHWPLCNGELLPRSPKLATLIELTHRVTSSLAGLLQVVVFVLALRTYPRATPVRRAATLGLVLMLFEGAIGALLVKKGLVAKDASEARAFVVALHLGNTFLLVAAQVATLRFSRATGPLRLRGAPSWALLIALLAVLLLSASGAVTALGDTLFPAKTLGQGVSDDFSSQAHFLVRLRVLHPLLAVFIGAFVLYLAQSVRAQLPTAEVKRWTSLVTLSYLLQVALGSLNLLLLAPAPVQIAHLLLADLTWIALVQLALGVWTSDQPSLLSAAS